MRGLDMCCSDMRGSDMRGLDSEYRTDAFLPLND